MKAFHRRMPRSSLDSAGLEVERNKNGSTLEEFFGGEGRVMRQNDCFVINE
jgi:hypothetical protein